jgi:hypothetical protein
MASMSLLGSRKTLDRMGKTINEGAGSAVSSFARKQMEKMGWQEGKGLGKNEDGMATHIKQKKKGSFNKESSGTKHPTKITSVEKTMLKRHQTCQEHQAQKITQDPRR